MRKCIFLGLMTLNVLLLNAQRKKEVFTFFDRGWNKVEDPNKGVFFTRLYPVDDTSWRVDTYDVYGPILKTETVSDKTAGNKNGKFAAYHPNGYIDSVGQYYRNKTHGDWFYISDAGVYLFQKTFDNGLLLNTIDLVKESQGEKTPIEKPSEFKGGNQGWSKYLIQNLRYPAEAMNARMMGDVIVMFLIDIDGKAKEAILFKSVEALLDAEAVRLIANSPKWVPAEQGGQKVRSYKRQSISFRTE